MTLDEVISHAENDFITWGTNAAMAELAIVAPYLTLPVISALTRLGINWVMTFVTKLMDFAGYHMFKTVQNNLQAGEYEDSIRASRDAAENGTDQDVAAAHAKQIDAFRKLWNLG